MTIQEHFEIYDKAALKVTNDSITVYKDLCDHISDKVKLKDLLVVSKTILETNLSAVFADLYSTAQPDHIKNHYHNKNLQPVIDVYILRFEKDCELYLKQIGKNI